MEDPFFGRLWDRFPLRRPHRDFYCSHPYAAANVTPTKPEYEYWGAPQLKPRTFTVPVHGPSNNTSPNSSSVTKANNPSKPNLKNVGSIPVYPVAPRMDETSAAIKIQSAFRGFSARKGAPLKNLRVIRNVKAEAEDIRRRLADGQVVESILRNEKEHLKITEGIMALVLKLDAIQGVSSFVRESRKVVIRELVDLQELVDAIFAGKPMEGTGSMGAEAAEDNKHGDEMAASAEEEGDARCSERSPNEKETRDEKLLERGPNEEEIRDEKVLDVVKIASLNDSEMQEEVSVLSDKIGRRNMQSENPNYNENISLVTGSNGGGESSEVVVSGQPGDLKEIKQEDQELERIDEEMMRDSIDEETCTDGASRCEGGQVGENMSASKFHSTPRTDEEVIRHLMDEEKSTNNALDCEAQTCKRLKDLVLSQAEAETIQADEEQKEGEGMECEDTGEVIEGGAGARESTNVEEDIVKVKDENEKLKKTVVDLFKKTVLQKKLINNMSLRVAKLEEQISKSERKKCGDKKKSNSTTRKCKTK